MKKLIITEEQEKQLIQTLKTPNGLGVKKYAISPDKVKVVSKFLDGNFKRGSLSRVGANGLPENVKIVAMIDGNGQVLKNMYKDQVKDLLIDHFSNMFLDEDERDRFMKQVLEDWYNNKIGTFGTLSVNAV